MTATESSPAVSSVRSRRGIPSSQRTAASADLDQFDDVGFARELEALRDEILESLGAEDAAYIRKVIRTQRLLDLGGRVGLLASPFVPGLLFAGVGSMALGKILENMEIGHNVMHGQWDWMRDPVIHSTKWEWDHCCPSTQWKHTHNHVHHQWANVRGKDQDVGYGLLRVFPEQTWRPHLVAQPLMATVLAFVFDVGISFHDVTADLEAGRARSWKDVRPKVVESLTKIGKQGAKDFVLLPALALPFGRKAVLQVAAGAFAANVLRNLWTFGVIFCGHFPDGAELFTRADVENETKGQWYRRQAMASANFSGGPLTHLMTGNLDYQVEHHLFPDMPSNRLAQAAPRVKEICERYGVRYNTGSWRHQIGTVARNIVRLSVPGDRMGGAARKARSFRPGRGPVA